MCNQAKKLLKKQGLQILLPKAPITDYSLEDRKLIEVVRSIYSDPEIFIVDETTTALSQRGRNIIYNLIQKFKNENKAVIFISHDLEEIMEVCSQLIVLRDGDFIAQLEKDEFEEEKKLRS